MGIRIAICDDDEIFRIELVEFCGRFFSEKISCEIREYASGEEYLAAEPADILLLDIEMEGMDGIEVKERLIDRHTDTQIIFVTNHGESMRDAFGKNVSGFLTKPVRYAEFSEIMKKVLCGLEAEQRFLTVQTVEKKRKVYLKDVLYLKASGKDVDIHAVGEVLASVKREGLGCWGERLEYDDFVQSHKSYLVNLAHVKRVGKEILLDNGERVKLSRDRKREFEETYLDYQERHIQ